MCRLCPRCSPPPPRQWIDIMWGCVESLITSQGFGVWELRVCGCAVVFSFRSCTFAVYHSKSQGKTQARTHRRKHMIPLFFAFLRCSGDIKQSELQHGRLMFSRPNTLLCDGFKAWLCRGRLSNCYVRRWSAVGCGCNAGGCKIIFLLEKVRWISPMHVFVCACICVCELGGVFWEPRNLINKLMHK